MLHCRQYTFPSEFQFCAADTASVADLFTRCCPGQLAADNADFMNSYFLGFGSVSIGFSLDTCDVDTANLPAGAAAVTTLLLSFLCSPLCISTTFASLITSLLRSNLSAPCGVTLRHSSTRTLQRCEWACALLLSLIASQPGHPTVAPELFNVLLADSFPLV